MSQIQYRSATPYISFERIFSVTSLKWFSLFRGWQSREHSFSALPNQNSSAQIYSQAVAPSQESAALSGKQAAQAMKDTAKRDSLAYRTTVFTLIAFGVVVRLVQYTANRSLWLDEAQLALVLLQRSARQLLELLPRGQGAAPAFLWAEQLALRTLGPSEYSLRFFPFLASILSIFLFYVIAKKWVSHKAAVIALFLFVISTPLIHWSAQGKQYAVDVLITLLIYLAVSVFQSRLTLLAAGLLGLAAAMAVWFSHPAIFTITAICFTLFASSLLLGNRAAAKNAILMWCITFASFGALYWISLRSLIGERELRIYHWGSFAPLPFSMDAISWYYESFVGIFDRSAGLSAPALAGFLFLVGIASVFKKSVTRACFLAAPLLFALVASGLHRYPFSDRFLLFAAPGIFLLVAQGLEQMSVALRSYLPLTGFVLIALLSIEPFLHSVRILFHPETVEELRPVLKYVQAHQQPGDVIYVYYGAEPAFDYYTQTLRFRTTARVVKGLEGRTDWRLYQRELNAFRGNPRVWVIVSHDWTGDGVDEQKLVSYDVDTIGRRIDTFRAPGAAAYLCDMRDRPAPQ